MVNIQKLFPYTRNEQPEKEISATAHKKLEKLSLNLANLILKWLKSRKSTK